MNIFSKDAEQALIDFVEKLRASPKQWRALHFHFSLLNAENKKIQYLQAAADILQNKMGSFPGTACFCKDLDLILIYEHTPSDTISSLITELRLVFVDDPLASAAYIEGKEDTFFNAYDFSFSFEQFFYLCLHKLALVKQSKDTPETLEIVERTSLPSASMFQRMAADRLERKQLRVLVVEDSYFSRQMIRQALTPFKHELLLAKDGWEGLSHYLNYAPNITFLDIDMPQMNGHEVLQKIKVYDPKPFVIMLTASNLSNDIKNAVTEGAKGYIVKPFTVGKLTAYIDQYCKEIGRPLSHR